MGINKKMYIIDYIGNSFEKKPIGHPNKVITQIIDLLSENFDMKTVLPMVYKELIKVDFELLHFCDLSKKSQKFYKLKCLYKKIKNIKDAFKLKDGYLFFVNIDFIIYLFIITRRKRKTKNIVIINYCNYMNMSGFIGSIKKSIYIKAKKKISLELNTYDYNNDNFIPDYYYAYNGPALIEVNNKVDFLVIGTMNEAKDIVSLIDAVKDSNYKLKIIGKFYDDIYYNKVKKISEGSNNIIIINKYLDSNEYKAEINKAKYVILPYNVQIYNNLTSGVFLDALYSNVPIICPSTPYFNQFKNLGIGIVYNDMNDLTELVRNDDYASYQENIQKFNLKLSKEVIKGKIVSLIN